VNPFKNTVIEGYDLPWQQVFSCFEYITSNNKMEFTVYYIFKINHQYAHSISKDFEYSD